MAQSKRVRVDVEGRPLALSNLDKVLYPAAGFTKGQVIDYYRRIYPVMSGHLKDRPLTLKRYPEGVAAEHFYEKQAPSARPDWLATAAIYSHHRGGDVDYILVDSLAAMLWVANLASLEMHTLLARADAVQRPTMMVFDLDPGAGADILDCAAVALSLRQRLEELGLACLVKTSGGKGLHVVTPLNTPVTYDQTKPFSHALAQWMQRRYPNRAVANMRKELRAGKVLVDWSQNDPHKTTVCAYSLRAGQTPSVSTPVTWEEVRTALEGRNAAALSFPAEEVLQRVARRGDLFAPALDMRQELPWFVAEHTT